MKELKGIFWLALLALPGFANAAALTCGQARNEIELLDQAAQAAGGCKNVSQPVLSGPPAPACVPDTKAVTAYIDAHTAQYNALVAEIASCDEAACPAIPPIPAKLCLQPSKNFPGRCITTPDADGDGIPDDLETQLIARFSPDLHFSVSSETVSEIYRPMDPITYVQHAKLVDHGSGRVLIPNSVLQSNAAAIMGTLTLGEPSDILDAYTFYLCQPNLRSQYAIAGLNDGSAVGADWPSVMAAQNIGMYAHISPFIANSAADFPDNSKVARFEDGQLVIPPSSDQTKCVQTGGDVCYKIEYYQFFGLNYDDAPFDIGLHQADLSMVTLVYDVTIDKILTVSHWAHGYEMRFDLGRYPVVADAKTDPLDQCAATVPTDPNAPFGNYKTCTGPNSKYQNFNILKIATKSDGSLGAVQDEPKKAQNNTLMMRIDPTSGKYSHPIVFVEYGSHEFWPTSNWGAAYAPSHNGQDLEHHYIATNVPNLGEIEHPLSPSAAIFIGYDGYWGNYNIENQVSPGPSLHASWNWFTSKLRKPPPPSDVER